MKVLKFGGSSVSDATNISRVLDITEAAANEDKVVLVSSAMSGVTDMLESLVDKCLSGDSQGCSDIMDYLTKRHRKAIKRLFSSNDSDSLCVRLDVVFSRLRELYFGALNRGYLSDSQKDEICGSGELLSTLILEAKLRSEHYDSLWMDARDMVVSDDIPLSYSNISRAIDEHPCVRIFVVPGFIARDSKGDICTLGRGGSDYSAAIFAAALDAEDFQIWTDVSGILTANPKTVSRAYPIDYISYEAAFAMASNGAKVLYAPTVAPAQQKGIAINIRNSFKPQDKGSVICSMPTNPHWVGLAAIENAQESYITLVSEGAMDAQHAATRAESALKQCGIAPISIITEQGLLRVVVKSVLSQASQAALHKEFFESRPSQCVNLYIAGHGKVGHALERLLRDDMASNSGKMLIIKEISSDRGLVQRLLSLMDRGAVFVDCTDSEEIYKYYIPLLEAGYNIVSSNRRSIAVPYIEYRAMKQAALKNGLFLRYETTVGASLPMLETISRSSSCGDRVDSIEAVVSCTLNYILSSDLPFDRALDKARNDGLTEKNPQDDLGGKDALRKLLILSREAGVPLDEEDVLIEPITEGSELQKDMRFVAYLYRDESSKKGYKAGIALRKVGPEHPAYWLRGTDNAIIIKSLYHPSPLVILGPGEGAELAASSILNDILL